jgi:hypothetical protein
MVAKAECTDRRVLLKIMRKPNPESREISEARSNVNRPEGDGDGGGILP